MSRWINGKPDPADLSKVWLGKKKITQSNLPVRFRNYFARLEVLRGVNELFFAVAAFTTLARIATARKLGVHSPSVFFDHFAL